MKYMIIFSRVSKKKIKMFKKIKNGGLQKVKMADNWIKINEIQFSPDDLSKKYNEEKIYNKDIEENHKIEELVNDNILIKQLKENAIPFKSKWEERYVKELYPRYFRKRFGGIKHYFVLIFIPKEYKSKYENIFDIRNQNDIEKEEEYIFEPIEKAKKIFNILMKTLILFSLGCIVYMTIQSLLQR